MADKIKNGEKKSKSDGIDAMFDVCRGYFGTIYSIFLNYLSMYKNIKILNKKQASWEKLNSGGIEGNHYYPIILCLVVYFTCWVRLRRFSDVKHPFCPNENVLILGRGGFRKNK